MTNKVARLKPANRHILIVPHTHKHEQQSNVLLPEGFLEEEDYVEATVVDVADDCKSQFKALKYGNLSENRVLVDKKMIQEIILKDRKHHLVLENYVLGVYHTPSGDD